jgi:AcrR family transcriptional regulator
MARKSSADKTGAAKNAASDSDDEISRILSAAMDEAAATGWAQVSFQAIANRSNLKLGEVLLHTPTKAYILARFADAIDKAALSDVNDVDDSQSVKDRLFDLMMRRFDALQKYRAGVLALMTGLSRDPAEGVMVMGRLSRSMAATLAAAGVPAHGLAGLAQTEGLKAVYLSALRAWRSDDSDDMAKTMAALDKALGYAEKAASFVKGKRRAAKPNPDPVEPEAAAASTGN